MQVREGGFINISTFISAWLQKNREAQLIALNLIRVIRRRVIARRDCVLNLDGMFSDCLIPCLHSESVKEQHKEVMKILIAADCDVDLPELLTLQAPIHVAVQTGTHTFCTVKETLSFFSSMTSYQVLGAPSMILQHCFYPFTSANSCLSSVYHVVPVQ